MNKTYYAIVKGYPVRYWYDRHLKLWTIHEVSQPNEDGDQIGESQYETSQQYVFGVAEYVVQCNHGDAHKEIAL